MIVATIKTKFILTVQSAIALAAAKVIVTAILVPILTAYWSNYMKSKGKVVEQVQSDEDVQGSEMKLKHVKGH